LVPHFRGGTLTVFENRVLRIFGPRREEDESWRQLHNDELHSLYSSPNIDRLFKSRRLEWAEHMQRMGDGRRRREDNIKMDLREIGMDGAVWIRLTQDRVQWRAFVSTVMNLQVP
jgi:hypothetical protein